MLNLTVNGTSFTSLGFRVAPGAYSAHATVNIGGTNFTSLANVTVSASGAITPAISVQNAAVTVSGSLRAPDGTLLPLNTTVQLMGPGGSNLSADALNGEFSLQLPSGAVFQVSVDTTQPIVGPNGTYFATYTTAPDSRCSTVGNASVCDVTLIATPDPVWLNGTLAAAGQPSPLTGTVRVVGPSPSTNLTVLDVTNGNFSLRVTPGVYSVYATAGGGSHPLAALTQVVALPSSPVASIVLAPTWNVLLNVNGPNGTVSGIAPATVALRGPLGSEVVYDGVQLGTSVPVALPVGGYTVVANSSGTPNGVTTPAGAVTKFSVAAGNVAVNVSLAYEWNQNVQGTLLGPTSETVAGGGTATFQFTIRDVGNLPVTVHPVGSPSYWKFGFSVGNVTLTPGRFGNTVTVAVAVTVPAGTVVSHPLVVIDLETASGVPVGTVAPAPTLNVVGYYGLALGPSVTLSPKVALAAAVVPFYVSNTGNTYELVRLAVADQARLQVLGWSSGLLSDQIKPVTGPAGLAAGANDTFYVNLTAIGSVFLPPGTVTVTGTVLNASGGVQESATLGVPTVTVRPTTPGGAPPVLVSGPNIGTGPSSLPTWVVPLLVFVPAVALAIAFVSWRWWKTRRWTRR
jgi:hypothetical protein